MGSVETKPNKCDCVHFFKQRASLLRVHTGITYLRLFSWGLFFNWLKEVSNVIVLVIVIVEIWYK